MILLLKRALGIPYVTRIDFFCFLYIKKFRKKFGFCIWKKITMTAIIERQRARLYTVMLIEMPRFQYIYYSSTIIGAI